MGDITSVTAKLRRDRARRLRRDQTDAETILWEPLRAGRLDGWK
jgi:very-short-patch-repair endonuclease